jgi:DNA-binding Lrp family transcriptional regulator
MKEYEVRKLIMRSKDLNASDKLVLLAMILKVDWETFQGRVSAREISKLISTGERSVKRTLSKLINLGIISRESKRISYNQNEPALTTLHIDKIDTSGEIDTSGKDDTSVNNTTTPSVVLTTTPSGNNTTTPSGKLTTHTIVTINNNNNQSSNSLVTSKWKSLDGEDNGFTEEPEEEEREIKKVYKFYLNSSIKDPEEREKVERHVLRNSHRLSHMDKERLLHPQLTKPLV